MKKILKLILSWNEFFTFPIAIFLWLFSDNLLRFIDSTAATFDQGVLQIPLFATICFLLMHSLVWLMIKIAFPKVYLFLDNTIDKQVNPSADITNYTLTLWQKTLVTMWLFSLYFSLAVLSLLAVN